MTVAVTRPVAQGYGCLIGNDYFRLVPSRVAPTRVYTQDSLATRQQDEPGAQGENVLSVGHAFGRQNMTGGEGLDWWPRPVGEVKTDLDLIRFWDSANLDIRRPDAGRAYSTTLSKLMETWWDPAGVLVDMGASSDAVYVAEGSNIHRFDDWVDNTPEDTDALASDPVMIDVGVDDTVVVTTDNGDIYVKASTSEVYVLVYDASAQPTPNALAAWWIKGRIIAAAKDSASAANGQVLEIAPGIGGTPAAPTSTPTILLVDTYAGDMLSCVDGGHAIVAGFSDGSLRSYVPQVDQSGTIPTLTVRAQTNTPQHEVPVTLGWNLAQLLILTLEESPSGGSKVMRLYSSSVQDERFDYAVGGDMQLLRVWEGVDEVSPHYTKQITTTRDEAFFTIGEDTDTHHIWRYDFVTQGLFRHLAAGLDCGRGITHFDGRLAACDGGAVSLESATDYAEEGYVIGPNVTFGLNTPIAWASFVVEVLHLETAGVAVELYRSTDPESILDPDHANWVLVRAFTDVSQSGVELGTTNIEGISLALMLRFHRSTSGIVSPDLKRFAVRGLPKHRDWICEVPINISDIVTAPGRMPLRIPNHGDRVHERVLELQGASRTFQLYDPPVTIRGQVADVAEPVTFDTDRGSQGQFCMVKVLGKLVGASGGESVQGDEGMGIGTMGIMTMGTGAE